MYLQGALLSWSLRALRTRILPGEEGFYADERPLSTGPDEQSRSMQAIDGVWFSRRFSHLSVTRHFDRISGLYGY
jgi:hypothetical protein